VGAGIQVLDNARDVVPRTFLFHRAQPFYRRFLSLVSLSIAILFTSPIFLVYHRDVYLQRHTMLVYWTEIEPSNLTYINPFTRLLPHSEQYKFVVTGWGR
jgi:hypothetical protein